MTRTRVGAAGASHYGERLTLRTGECECSHCNDPANCIEEREERRIDRKEAYQLFKEYEAQRREKSLYTALHADAVDFWLRYYKERVEQNPSVVGSGVIRLVAPTCRLRKACTDFEKALLKLRNLKEVQVCFTRRDDFCFFNWRNHEFCDIDICYGKFYGLRKNRAIEEEAAPLAFLFPALGKRNSSSNSLTSLRLDLRMDSWWGLQDLLATWILEEDEEEEEDEEDIKAEKVHLISTGDNTFTMEAFYHLTDVHIRFTKRDDMTAFLNSLAMFLSRAKKLRRLELRFENPNDRWQGLDMLCAINKHFQWPMLSHLSLQGFEFPGSSILQTFSSAAPTLQSFSLRNCLLHGGETPWSQLFEDIRRIPFQNLHRSEFRICEQDIVRQDDLNTEPQPWSYQELDARSMVLIRIERGDEDYLMGYSSLIYDYILKRTDVMPPLKLFSTSATDSGSFWAE